MSNVTKEKRKRKSSFKTMLKLFDEAWKTPTPMKTWGEACDKHGWTDEEFDAKLTEYYEEKMAKLNHEEAA